MKTTVEERVSQWEEDNPMAMALTNEELCKELDKKLSHTQDGKCPYCGQMVCHHWTGLGWVRTISEPIRGGE